MSDKKLAENQEDLLKRDTGRRLKELREHFGLRQAEFIAPWKGKIGTYSSVETGKNGLSEQLIRLLLNYYRANPVWLLTGVGAMILPEDLGASAANGSQLQNSKKEQSDIITVTVDSSGEENITIVTAKARGGYPTHHLEPEFLRDLPAFSLPGARYKNGTFRAFEVAGDSMQTTIYAGDLIIAEQLYKWATDITDGDVHIIVTRDDILVKRVYNRLMESGHLMLNSDNISYTTQMVEGEEVLEVWRAKAKLSDKFVNTHYDAAKEVANLQAEHAELADEFDDFKKAVAEKLGLSVRDLKSKKPSRKS
ncbi:S24 family peptidase [Hymenobacter sp. YC55]|uniref:XRE family transcriptional regulator n=1 Tax=Hymenobacter sp. YC55 TaxID=3034019 RepID=UPI0023F6CEEB|nr:S24 family peptidase [Hymenobacter sp. YC55]MDF7810475.1 S24 family peptidase [Hymenobacter sp. YC55]